MAIVLQYPRAAHGQAMTEYISLVSILLVALLGAMALFMDGIGVFYQNVLKVICLPFP